MNKSDMEIAQLYLVNETKKYWFVSLSWIENPFLYVWIDNDLDGEFYKLFNNLNLPHTRFSHDIKKPLHPELRINLSDVINKIKMDNRNNVIDDILK